MRQPLLLLLLVFSTDCSNWAQLSGSNNQNTVSSDEHPPWSRRWGFASVVIQQTVLVQTADNQFQGRPGASASPSPVPLYSAPSKLVIMGGDTWSPDATSIGKAARPFDGMSSQISGGKTGGQGNGFGQDFVGRPLSPNQAVMEPDSGGYGGLSNDVFYTTGASWRVFTDYRQTSPYGDPTPIISSNVTWNRTTHWEGLYEGYVTWKDYLGCCHETHPFPCSRNPPPCGVIDGTTTLIDNIKDHRRWTPRRGHSASAVIYGTATDLPAILLTGGRALSLDGMDSEDIRGGALFDTDSTKRSPVWLMNDVWISTDYGDTWDFLNAGCWVNDQYTVLWPGPELYRCTSDEFCFLQGLGKNTKCWYGPYVAVPTPGKSIGTCVCKHWSPREHHASAVSWLTGTPVLYVTGGVSFVQRQICGKYACGKGNAHFNRDAWASYSLGATWSIMTSDIVPDDASGRSDHALIYAASNLYLISGRGLSDEDSAKESFFSDTQVSQVGILWRGSALGGALIGARAQFSTSSDSNTIIVFGGNVALEASPSPSPAPPSLQVETAAGRISQSSAIESPDTSSASLYNVARGTLPGELLAGLQRYPTSDFFTVFLNDVGLLKASFTGAVKNVWYKDWENPSMRAQNTYVYPRWPLSSQLPLLNVSKQDAQALAAHFSITDALGLSLISYGNVKLCLDVNQVNIPDVCAYKRAAQRLVNHCTPRFRPWTTWLTDYAYSNGIWPIQQMDPVPLLYPEGWSGPPTADDGCLSFSPVPNPYERGAWASSDFVCRSTPSPRAFSGTALMDDKMYVFGGKLEPGIYANDLWVRDDTLPTTRWVHVPDDGGGKETKGDTTLSVNANEPGCIFEARFWSGKPSESGLFVPSGDFKLLRDWTLIPSTFETQGINSPNTLTTVQVRAVDPAGNKDPAPISYSWTYIPPFPVGSIALGVLGALAAIALIYWLYRRWKRRKELEALARRRLQRAANEKSRQRRMWKKVKKFKKTEIVKTVRNRAHNAFSETQADLRNKLKELLQVRGVRNREAMLALADRPLVALSPTKEVAQRPKYDHKLYPVPLWKDSFGAHEFDPSTLGSKGAHEIKQLERTFNTMLIAGAQSDKAKEGAVMDIRDGAAADKFRSGLAFHSDGLYAQAMQGISADRVPVFIAKKAAIKQARREGRKEDDAWETSLLQSTLAGQMAKCVVCATPQKKTFSTHTPMVSGDSHTLYLIPRLSQHKHTSTRTPLIVLYRKRPHGRSGAAMVFSTLKSPKDSARKD